MRRGGRRRVPVTLLALLLAACATPEPQPPAPAPEAASPAPRAPPPSVLPERQPLKHLAGRKLKPMPMLPLNVRTRCAFRDETGTRGRLDLWVKNAEVQRFSAEVNMPKHGTCRFDMKDFRQTDKLPAVRLADAASGCSVRMWEQELDRSKGVTVAFSGCQAQCSGESFSYLWPILVDTRNGRCS